MNGQRSDYPWHYGLPLALYYAALGIYQGLIPKYFQSIGIATSSVEMMFLMASAPMVALVAQPVWGMIADRLKMRNNALVIMLLGAMGFMALLQVSKGFSWLMAGSCLFAAFYTPISPMNDAIVLESLQKTRAAFGPLRLMGSIGFALTNLLLIGYFEGRYHLVPWATVISLGLLLAAVQVFPKTPGHQRGRQKVPMRRILQIEGMMPLLALVTALQLAMGYYYSYFTIHFTSLPGGSAGMLGLAYAISAVFEIPFLLFADKLYRRLGAGRLMVISSGLLTLRFLIISLAVSPGWLLVSQVLHGGGFIVIMVSMAKYINETVPDELKSGGQMLLAVVGYGLARVFGTFCGGFIASLTGGPAGGFLAMGGLCLAALAWSAPYFFSRPPLNGQAFPERLT